MYQYRPMRRRSLLMLDDVQQAALSGGDMAQPGSFHIYQVSGGALYRVWNNQTGNVLTSGTDLGALITAAHAQLPTSTSGGTVSGGVITVGPGEWNLSTTAVLTKYGTVLRGEAFKHATTIKLAASLTAGRAMIEIGASTDDANTIARYITIENLYLYGKQNDATITTGRGINSWGSFVKIRNLTVQATNEHGIYCAGPSSGAVTAYSGRIENVDVLGFGRATEYTQHGIFLDTGVSDWDVVLCNVTAAAGTHVHDNGANGFHINAGTIRMAECHAWHNNGNGHNPATTKIAGFYLDGNNIELSNCIAESNNGSGVYIAGQSDIGLIELQAYANGRSATEGSASTNVANVFANGANTRLRIIGCKFKKGVDDAPNIYRHVYLNGAIDSEIIGNNFNDAQQEYLTLAASSTGNIIMANRFGLGLTYGGTASNGISGTPATNAAVRLSSSGVHNNIVAFNITQVDFQEDTSANGNHWKDNIFLGGASFKTPNASSIFRGNQGLISEAAGVAIVANGTTAIAVNHTLSTDFTPSASMFQITLTNTPSNDLVRFGLSTAFTSAQFTINVGADPGANTAVFAWRMNRNA